MKKTSSKENVRVSRIKELLKREGLKQKDLAYELDMEPQNFSRFMISGKVSEKTCEKIVKLYPDYRIEWLLGYDDLMTHYDWANSVQHMKDLVADSMWGVIEKSLNKKGKSLKFVHRSGQHIDSTERLHADCYYSVVDSQTGKELKRLTALEMVQFEEKIQEYCDFMSEKYL